MQSEYAVHTKAYEFRLFLGWLMTSFEERRAQREGEMTRILAERKKNRPHKEKRRKLCITLPPDLYIWLCAEVASGRYYNVSHALQLCVQHVRRHHGKNDE